MNINELKREYKYGIEKVPRVDKINKVYNHKKYEIPKRCKSKPKPTESFASVLQKIQEKL